MYNVTSVKEASDVVEALQAIADAIPPANAVPDVTSADDGKVLKATYSGGEGSYDWDTPDSGLPSTSGHNINEVLVIDDSTLNPPTADWYLLDEVLPNMSTNNYPSNGDVIAYNSSTQKAEWQTPQGGGGGLPTITSNDNSKVLTAVYDDKSGTGYAEWQSPSGRVGYVLLDKTEFTYNDKSGEYSINYGATDKYVLSVVATENYGNGKQKVISEYSLDTNYSMLYIDGTTFSALSDYAYIALYFML